MPEWVNKGAYPINMRAMIINLQVSYRDICLFLTLFTACISQTNLIAQQTFICGMEGPEYENSGSSLIFDDFDFFPPEQCGTPLYINCRFVFFTRENGTGVFSEGSPFTQEVLDAIVEKANNKWKNIRDATGCSSQSEQEYPVDANFRMNVTYDYIADEVAWDYYARRVQMGSYVLGSFCPDFIMSNNSSWPYLRDKINDYNAQHPSTFNFFFVENGDLIRTIEGHLANGTVPQGPYSPPLPTPIFSGCSRLPQGYYSTSDQFVIMANLYSEWLARTHFGTILYPDAANAGADNATIAKWHMDGQHGTIVHELGHSVVERTIVHETFNCMDNIMRSGAGYNQHLVPMQLSRLHRNMMTSNNHRYISCEDITETTCNVIITENEVFDEPISIYGNLIVMEGITLTVTSDMYLSKHSFIDLKRGAKLVVDGGLLTSGCGEKWKGIRVTGGNVDFDVKFTNNAVVENAGTAVSMFPPLPWPEITEHGNGIIHADNTTFNNVGRIAELIAFQPSLNGSYFRNCTQNGGTFGITNWNCQLVEVSGCIFNDIESNAIVTETGSFTIEGNTFHSGENDILFANVSAGIASIIRDNDFYGDKTGIRALGTTFDQNQILENRFHTGTYDIWVEGDNNFLVRKNSFNSLFGIVSINSGTATNDIIENVFVNDIVGIFPAGQNLDLSFVENCFETNYTDTYIVGRIAQIISNGNTAANNCFTHDGNLESSVPDVAGTPDDFTYIEPVTNATNCLNALFAPENVNVQAMFLPDDEVCANAGAGVSDLPDTESAMCNPENTIQASLAAKNILVALLAQMPALETVLPVNLNGAEIQQLAYMRCLKKVERQLFELYLEAGLFAEARASLGISNLTNDDKVATFSSYIAQGDLTGASNYLETLQTVDEDMLDFIAIQQINLDRLNQGAAYQIDTFVLASLETLAAKTHPYAAYGKALVYVLTGKLMESELPKLEVGKKSLPIMPAATNKPIDAVRVYPNPTDGIFNIALPAQYEQFEAQLTDVSGKLLFYRFAEGNEWKMDLSHLKPGIYLLTLWSEGAILHREKIILNR